jgi:hypothetical protein
LKGWSNTNEFYINYYTNRFGVELALVNSKDYSGWCSQLGNTIEISSDMLKARTLNISGYYAFNHRRFSFPAAFTQSYIQCRSAGSWLAGLSYQAGSLETTNALMLRNPTAPDTRLYVGHVGIGGGYGYNWVIGKKWLFHISLLPTAVVYNRNNMTIRGERKKAEHIRFNMIFNERVAIVHYLSSRYFAGATLVMNNSVFDDDVVVINQNKWRARAFVGMRL